MEKELTEHEAIRVLDNEYADYAMQIIKSWNGKKMPGRDGAYTQELKALNAEQYQKLLKIKEMYYNCETLPESEVMKIVKGKF